jgi:glycosyltransferase involved in cell wall biosynthesis
MTSLSKPLSITHIISRLAVGGAQQLLLDSCLELMARGHKVQVIGLRPASMAAEFRERGIPVTELAMNGAASLGTLWRLTSLLRSQRPDVVHTHLGRADSCGRVAAFLAQVPAIVSTLHNLEPWKSQAWMRWTDAATSRLADRLIACSERVAQHVRELGLVPARKITVVQNGIRLADWASEPSPEAVSTLRASLGTAAGTYVLGVVARLEEQKGHEHLFHALAAVGAGMPNYSLWLVGEGSQQAALARRAAQLGLQSKISFLGPRRDLRLVYAALDLVVLPSLWEGLPIALLEAMACRRPIVATTVGGVPEVISHGQNGLLCAPRDVRGLGAAILRCRSNRAWAEGLGTSAFEHVAQFGIEPNISKVLAIYRHILLSRQRNVVREPVNSPARPPTSAATTKP